MKNIISSVAILLGVFLNGAQAQLSSVEEAFALAKNSGRSVFLLGGLKD